MDEKQYALSEDYKKDLILIRKFSDQARKMAEQFDTPLLAPAILRILWERRNDFEDINGDDWAKKFIDENK